MHVRSTLLALLVAIVVLPAAVACAPPRTNPRSTAADQVPDDVPEEEPASPPSGGELQDVVKTQWGPLNAADRDLIIKVRLAGLWEIPVGRQAAQRAARPQTRTNLGEISKQHVQLDQITRVVAAKLNVPLPNQPNSDQQKWIDEISGKTGVDYDRTAVLRLRQAHGKVYPVIAAVRGSTANTLVRDFAEQAERFVHRHMALLEGTGLVGAQALPTAPTVTDAPPPLPSDQRAPSAPPATQLQNSN